MGKTVDFQAWVDAKEEEIIDEQIGWLYPILEAELNGTYRFIPDRVQELLDTVAQLEQMMKDTNAKIRHEIGEHFPRCGGITIECDLFEFDKEDLRILSDIVERADSTEITPLVNGNVEIVIGFTGIAERLN